jgi:hypothetical protein
MMSVALLPTVLVVLRLLAGFLARVLALSALTRFLRLLSWLLVLAALLTASLTLLSALLVLLALIVLFLVCHLALLGWETTIRGAARSSSS